MMTSDRHGQVVGGEHMLVLQNALSKALHSCESSKNKCFTFTTNNYGLQNYFPTLVPYCSDKVDAKKISVVKHCVAIVRSF